MNTLPNSVVADFFKLYKHSKKVDCTFYIGFSDIANSIIREGAHIHVLHNQYSFEINYFHGLRTQIYEYMPPSIIEFCYATDWLHQVTSSLQKSVLVQLDICRLMLRVLETTCIKLVDKKSWQSTCSRFVIIKLQKQPNLDHALPGNNPVQSRFAATCVSGCVKIVYFFIESIISVVWGR